MRAARLVPQGRQDGPLKGSRLYSSGSSSNTAAAVLETGM